jgi:hypothetical protein
MRRQIINVVLLPSLSTRSEEEESVSCPIYELDGSVEDAVPAPLPSPGVVTAVMGTHSPMEHFPLISMHTHLLWRSQSAFRLP